MTDLCSLKINFGFEVQRSDIRARSSVRGQSAADWAALVAVLIQFGKSREYWTDICAGKMVYGTLIKTYMPVSHRAGLIKVCLSLVII